MIETLLSQETTQVCTCTLVSQVACKAVKKHFLPLQLRQYLSVLCKSTSLHIRAIFAIVAICILLAICSTRLKISGLKRLGEHIKAHMVHDLLYVVQRWCIVYGFYCLSSAIDVLWSDQQCSGCSYFVAFSLLRVYNAWPCRRKCNKMFQQAMCLINLNS